MTTPTVAISQDFLGAYAQIPRAQQKKVMEFVTKFRHDPFSGGINYEKINNAADPNFRSVRIDQDYRGIVLSPERGDAHVLLWVAKHDDAYDWAQRHQCSIHPETGNLQLLETETVSAQEEVPDTDHEGDAGSPESSPMFSLRDRELLRLGVPEKHIPLVREVRTEDDLDHLEQMLPQEAFEALFMLAAGSNLEDVMQEYGVPQQPVDTSDFATALHRDHSRRQFHVVADEAELQEMLNAPLEKWRVFLHPSQRRLVEWDCNGPIRVLGGAGTGKTVVAIHRARWLVRNFLKAQRKVLFTTFTRNLAMDIQENLRKICHPEEMERIEVLNIDAWISRFLKRHDYPHRIVYPGDDEYRSCWQIALDAKPSDPDLPDSFYEEEWERVVLPQRNTERDDYLKARRTGRGVALNRKQRAALWPVFEEMLIQMHQRGLRAAEQATQDAVDLLGRASVYLPYEAVVIDEAQDMGPDVMSLVRNLVPRQANDLFIVGDGHQRIYRRRYSLSQCGIEVRGRSRKLRINYRTTEETRRFAVSVLEGLNIDDLDGANDAATGYRSLMHGESPLIENLASQEKEVEWVADQLQGIVDQGGDLREVCIVARTESLLRQYESALQGLDIATRRISRTALDDRKRDGVRLATMHRVKGLEFRYMFICAVNSGVVPLSLAVEKTEDEVERRSAEVNERALFHVAASRAINRLYVSSSGEPSNFIRSDAVC